MRAEQQISEAERRRVGMPSPQLALEWRLSLYNHPKAAQLQEMAPTIIHFIRYYACCAITSTLYVHTDPDLQPLVHEAMAI